MHGYETTGVRKSRGNQLANPVCGHIYLNTRFVACYDVTDVF